MLQSTLEEHNAHAADKERHEHPTVKRARLQVSKVNDLNHKMHLANAALANAKIQLARDLYEMAQSGAPDEPWAAHWRRALDRE